MLELVFWIKHRNIMKVNDSQVDKHTIQIEDQLIKIINNDNNYYKNNKSFKIDKPSYFENCSIKKMYLN